MTSRRGFLKLMGGGAVAGLAVAGYGFGIEPLWRLNIARYQITPKNWPSNFSLKVAALSDIHVCKPWMTLERLEYIVETTNALGADIIVLLGDYSTGMSLRTGLIHSKDWAPVLGKLKAPLGVHAVMGNHDWWDDKTAQRKGRGPTYGHHALQKAGVNVHHNEAVRLSKSGQPFWVAGLGDQLALLARRTKPPKIDALAGQKPPKRTKRGHLLGVDDLDATMAKITDDAPALLLAHEPDIFPQVPDKISLTLCGHTHGGQVRLFGYSPIVPSKYGNRYAYGHVVEKDRHLLVTGGLGVSILPVRFGMPPEIALATLGTPS